MKATIKKIIHKEKNYNYYTSKTVYYFENKPFYSGIAKLKKILKNKGYTDYEIIDSGVSKYNY